TPALLLVGYFNGDMTSALKDTVCAAFCTRFDTLHMQTFIHEDRGYFQLINISAFVMLCIGYCRLKHFLNYCSALLRAECQNIQGIFNTLAADLISHQTRLLRRQASTA